jgi:hypothetical protein
MEPRKRKRAELAATIITSSSSADHTIQPLPNRSIEVTNQPNRNRPIWQSSSSTAVEEAFSIADLETTPDEPMPFEPIVFDDPPEPVLPVNEVEEDDEVCFF